MKRRVLQVGLSPNLGGIESFVMNVYRRINRNKIQFDFLSVGDNAIYFADEIIDLGGGIISISAKRQNPIKYYASINNIIKNNNYDFIHYNILTDAGLDFAKAAIRANKCQVIIHSHQYMPVIEHKKTAWLHKQNRAWLQNRQFTRIACSSSAAEFAFGGESLDKVSIVKNGIDIDSFKYNNLLGNECKKQFGIENHFVIGCIARFAYQKNYEFLLNIFYEIKKIIPEAVLVCVGGDGGMKDEIISLYERSGLMASIIFTGIREDVSNILQSFDAFVLPSRWEGFGMVFLEAQAAGVPTFASDVVPDSVCVTDLITKMPLTLSPEVWADMIVEKTRTLQKRDTSEEIRQHGFDITETVRFLETLYMQ